MTSLLDHGHSSFPIEAAYESTIYRSQGTDLWCLSGRAVELKPDLGGRVGELMRRTLKIELIIDDLVGALRDAGLPA